MNRRPKEKFDFEEAKEKALNLLEFRAHSRKEIFDKLRRFTDAQTAGEVADALEEAGLINDEEYAYQCAHDLMELRFFGPNRVKQELSRRGISPETAEEAIFRTEEETCTPEERLRCLIERKYKNSLKDEKNIAKTINSLFRLGYGYDMIKNTLYEIKEETEDESNGTQ